MKTTEKWQKELLAEANDLILRRPGPVDHVEVLVGLWLLRERGKLYPTTGTKDSCGNGQPL